MSNIRAVTASDLRNHFKDYADDVASYGDVIMVARPKSRNVVLISQEEYNSIRETNYLLGTKANREALQHSIAQAERGETHHLTPSEFKKLSEDD